MAISFLNLFVLLSLSSLQLVVLAKTFNCLDGCECDTIDRSIDCTNDFNRKYLKLPTEPMLGYGLIGLTNTALKTLPPEKILNEYFPDLIIIHIKGTPNFCCSSLEKYYQTIEIMSDCKPIDKKNKPSLGDESEERDYTCKIKNYFARLWKLLKHKYNEWTDGSVFFDFIHKIISKMGAKVSRFF